MPLTRELQHFIHCLETREEPLVLDVTIAPTATLAP